MQTLGFIVMSGVVLWLAPLALVALRSAFFLFTLLWLAALHALESWRGRMPPPASPEP